MNLMKAPRDWNSKGNIRVEISFAELELIVVCFNVHCTHIYFHMIFFHNMIENGSQVIMVEVIELIPSNVCI